MYRTNLSTLERTGNQTFATESWWAVWQSAGSLVGAHGSQCFTPPRNHFRGKIRMDYSWIWAHPTKLWSPPPTSTATNRPQPGKGNRGPKPNETIMVPGSVLCLRCYVEVSYELLTDILVRRKCDLSYRRGTIESCERAPGTKPIVLSFCCVGGVTLLVRLCILYFLGIPSWTNGYLFVKKIDIMLYDHVIFLAWVRKNDQLKTDRQNID